MEESNIKISSFVESQNLTCGKCGSRCRKNFACDFFECINPQCDVKESSEKIRRLWNEQDIKMATQREKYMKNFT